VAPTVHKYFLNLRDSFNYLFSHLPNDIFFCRAKPVCYACVLYIVKTMHQKTAKSTVLIFSFVRFLNMGQCFKTAFKFRRGSLTCCALPLFLAFTFKQMCYQRVCTHSLPLSSNYYLRIRFLTLLPVTLNSYEHYTEKYFWN